MQKGIAASDAEILQRLRHDDESALDSLYRAYRLPLFLSAYRLLKDKEKCEDILQDVFTDIWMKRKHRNIEGPVKTYLVSMVRYRVFREIRKGSSRPELYENLSERFLSTADKSFDQVEYKELRRAIEKVVGSLPEKCREVYVLSREMNLSHKEIAEKLNISTKTVENQLLKSSKALRNSLKHFISIGISILFAAIN